MGKGKTKKWIAGVACLLLLPLAACGGAATGMSDGYYTAEAAEFDAHGWKEFVIICVRDGQIVTVEYDAKNLSGLIKSWDMNYMRVMNETDGTYPNEYTRTYSEALLNRQDPAKVDAVAGATHSYQTFQLLAEAVMEQARAGDENIAYVDVPEYE